jgi:thymidylate synthase
MKTIYARNVHQALPEGVHLLKTVGHVSTSRNGSVYVAPYPVTTSYDCPKERVVFWPERDINIAFLVYEALWMLAGRNDIAPLTRYVKRFDEYSNDGVTMHGAYGHRWRKHFGFDQLAVAASRLQEFVDDRRTVVCMWDPRADLSPTNYIKDVPCNDAITFQRSPHGEHALNMHVFCRSNDMIWGKYFANAFHFSMLLEYMAAWIDCPVGAYEHISVNYHAYSDKLNEIADIPHPTYNNKGLHHLFDPYADKSVVPAPIWDNTKEFVPDIGVLDMEIKSVLVMADSGYFRWTEDDFQSPMMRVAAAVLESHHLWRTLAEPERFVRAQDVLAKAAEQFEKRFAHANDWIVSMQQWVGRRHEAWEQKMTRV